MQKYYTKRISSISNLSYKQQLQCLKLDSLELRRLYFDMRMVYKIIHGLIDVTFDDLFTFSPNRSTRGHVYKLHCSKSNLNVRSYFFSQRCITAFIYLFIYSKFSRYIYIQKKYSEHKIVGLKINKHAACHCRALNLIKSRLLHATGYRH